MSEPMREEVELPPIPEPTTSYVDIRAWNLGWREDQLKAALSANREKDAEIARLKEEAGEIEGILRAYDYSGTIRDKLLWLESDMLTAQRKQKMLESQLASLRASGGEKPEDAYKRGKRICVTLSGRYWIWVV